MNTAPEGKHLQTAACHLPPRRTRLLERGTRRRPIFWPVIDEREVLAEREPMLEAGALRDIQAEGWRLRQDRVDGIALIGRIGQFWKSF